MRKGLNFFLAPALLFTLPAAARSSPQAAADALVEKARSAIADRQLAWGRKYLDAAIRKVPEHAEAHAVSCSLTMRDADAQARALLPWKDVLAGFETTAGACGRAAAVQPDASQRAWLHRLQLRALLTCERWEAAASVFESLIAADPDDGRLVGGYAAVLDRAGRSGESRAAMVGAVSRGTEFDRAARFEFVWDRFDRAEAARLGPMIVALIGEETDPRRRDVLEMLQVALVAIDEKVLLEFLHLVEADTLNRQELDKLWWSLASPILRDNQLWPPEHEIDQPGFELPLIAKKVLPVYPELAIRKHQSGKVIVLARINVDGSVGPVWVVGASGGEFALSALDAIRARRYVPAKRDGKSIPLPFTIRVDFRLQR